MFAICKNYVIIISGLAVERFISITQKGFWVLKNSY